MEYRLHRWFDTRGGATKYGVQAKVGARWLHCHEDGTPLIFDTEDDATAKLEALREGGEHD